MQQFKIGDRVEGAHGEGNITETVEVLGNRTIYLVKHDEPFAGGHDGDNPGGVDGYCWYYQEEEIRLIETMSFEKVLEALSKNHFLRFQNSEGTVLQVEAKTGCIITLIESEVFL
jgi:hypothetical protein